MKPYFGRQPTLLRTGTRRFDNLVFLQCGAGSVHKRWYSPLGRQWDLLVNHYEEPEAESLFGDSALYQKGTKFSGIYNAVKLWPGLLDYRYILLLDDDIVIGVEALNRLFETGRSLGLDLFQASLTSTSPGAWPALKTREGSVARPVSAAEIMMPVYSGRALAHCIDRFPESLSGWGLDLLSAKLVGEAFGTTPHVIDTVQARHAKDIDTEGGAYYQFIKEAGLDARAELDAICRRYGLSPEIEEMETKSVRQS